MTLAALMKQGGLAETEVAAAKDYKTQKYLSSELASLGWGKWRDSVGGKRPVCWHAPKNAVEAGVEGDEPESCTGKLYDGATCGQPIKDGRCPVADTHADQGRDGPPPAAPAYGGDLSGQGGFSGMEPPRESHFTGSHHPLTVEIERRLTQLASFAAELRADLRADPSSGEALIHLDQCSAYRLGLEGFAAVNPAFVLNSGHVAALGGAPALLNIIQFAMLKDRPAQVLIDHPPDWKGILWDLHRVAVERQREDAPTLRRSLSPRLLTRMQPRLKGF